MVMEVVLDGVPIEQAAATAQARAEELIQMRGYAEW
jgi:hypothetical protein